MCMSTLKIHARSFAVIFLSEDSSVFEMLKLWILLFCCLNEHQKTLQLKAALCEWPFWVKGCDRSHVGGTGKKQMCYSWSDSGSMKISEMTHFSTSGGHSTQEQRQAVVWFSVLLPAIQGIDCNLKLTGPFDSCRCSLSCFTNQEGLDLNNMGEWHSCLCSTISCCTVETFNRNTLI